LRKPALSEPGVAPVQPRRSPLDEIPQTKAERDRLLRVVRRYVDAHNPVPPLSLDELHDHAGKVAELAELDGKHAKWLAVLVNSAVWSETLASVPYERRLLLLPQCLRSEEGCAAEIDEFGLVCGHCGLCPIHHLQEEAERLGYVVLVAEGTVVVTSLIESRRIDAIVGVSCLSVLERVFPYMDAAAIPGIAIPLLRDGCANTAADIDWVREAIYLTSDDKSRRLNLDALRDEVDSWFTPESLAATMGPAHSQTEKIARAWLAKSGKRWRPFLTACAWRAFQEDLEAPLPEDLRRIAVAVECFHKASLVHDDIEDNDALRYGERTVHEAYGIPIALNVGDLLVGEGYRLIAESQASDARKAEMLRVATTGHRSLCIGQGEELCWMRNPVPLPPQRVLDIFRRKTAPAFEVALRLGAICAGADNGVREVLRDYSEALGIAYQICDDLDEFRGGPESHRPQGAEPSIVLAIAYEHARGSAGDLLEAVWRRPSRAGAMRERLEHALADLHVQEAASQMLESYKEKAINSLRPLKNASLKGLLRRVVCKIFNEIEAKG